MLSEMRLVKSDRKIIVPFFNVRMLMIPEYVAPFLLKFDVGSIGPLMLQSYNMTRTFIRMCGSKSNIKSRGKVYDSNDSDNESISQMSVICHS